MTTHLLALLLAGAATVSTGADVPVHLGQRVTVEGQIERVPVKDALGTAVVLDDDTIIYVTYGAPPAGWKVGARVQVDGLLSPSLDDDHRTLMAPHLRMPGAPVEQKRALVEQRLRLSGLASDAKGGAVVLIGSVPVYLEGMSAWPPGTAKHRVAVGGTLVRRAQLPAATKNAKGEVAAGASGPQWVLTAPTWRPLEVSK